jgi:DedD protein
VKNSLKQRLVGAFVLAAIAVIFLPSFVKENQPYRVDTDSRIPPRPDITPIRFSEPQAPADIDAALAPETMFLSADDQQPVADTLEALQERPPEDPTASAQKQAQAPAAEDPSLDARGLPQAWVVQVASLSSSEAAVRLRDRLQTEGHKAYIRTASTPNGEVSRVFIGPKLDREEAQEVKVSVDKLLKVESLVVRFQP